MNTANQRQVGGVHYGGATYQHWDWVVENRLEYLEGQITKYVSRHKKKNGLQDLEKALHYADKLYEVKKAAGWMEHYPWGGKETRGLLAMIQLYDLNPQEQLIFRLAVEYRNLEDLDVMRGALRNLVKNSRTPS